MKFDQRELDQILRLPPHPAILRALTPEVRLGKEELPKVRQAISAAREALDNFPPSQVIQFTAAFETAVTDLRRLEIIEGRLSNNLSRWTTKLAVADSAATRDVRAVAQLLRQGVVKAHPATGREDRISTTHGTCSNSGVALLEKVTAALSKAELADQCEALLALVTEWGITAEVPA